MSCTTRLHPSALPPPTPRPWRRWRGGSWTALRSRRGCRRCSRTCKSPPTRQVGRGLLLCQPPATAAPLSVAGCQAPGRSHAAFVHKAAGRVWLFQPALYRLSIPASQAAWSSSGARWPPPSSSRACSLRRSSWRRRARPPSSRPSLSPTAPVRAQGVCLGGGFLEAERDERGQGSSARHACWLPLSDPTPSSSCSLPPLPPPLQLSSPTSARPRTACSTSRQYQGRTWWGSRTATWRPTSRWAAGWRCFFSSSQISEMVFCPACLLLPRPGSREVLPPSHIGICFQVCGTAQYVDDIKLPAGALHAALVLSTRPHARILKLDTAAAAAMPGVAGVFTGGQGGQGAGPASQPGAACWLLAGRLAGRHLAAGSLARPANLPPRMARPQPRTCPAATTSARSSMTRSCLPR